MTKGEAKERWCPFVRVFYMPSNPGVMPPPAFNRSMSRLADGSMGTDMPPAARCVGAQCMAWRWNDDFTDDAPIEDRQGYSGLAGRP